LKMCYFLINILKIAMIARRSVIRLQSLLYFWLKLHFIIQQFLCWRCEVWFCPRCRVPSLRY